MFIAIILAGHLGQHTQMVALLINLLIVASYSSSIEVLGQRAIKQSATLRTSFHLHHANEGKGYSKCISNVHCVIKLYFRRIMITSKHVDLNLDNGCKTVSGPRPNNRCTFPFKYKRVLYWKCTTEDNFGIPWCATKVWSDGRVLGSDYGNCGPGCSLGSNSISL